MKSSTLVAVFGGLLVAGALGGGAYFLTKKKAPGVTSTASAATQKPAQPTPPSNPYAGNQAAQTLASIGDLAGGLGKLASGIFGSGGI